MNPHLSLSWDQAEHIHTALGKELSMSATEYKTAWVRAEMWAETKKIKKPKNVHSKMRKIEEITEN